MRTLKYIPVQACLRLKLFFKDKMTVFVLAVSIFGFLLCMNDLNKGADEKAAIPIGLIDLDGSEKSAELVERVKSLDTFLVAQGNYEELERLLKDSQIRCILEIKNGYEKKVLDGKYRKLLNVYYEEGDNVATLITDIVAGEMMYELCQAEAYLAYEELFPEEKEAEKRSAEGAGADAADLPEREEKQFTREEYEAYAASLVGGDDFDFAFEFRFLDGETERGQGVKNSLFYRQAVAAVAAVLFSLLLMTAVSGVCLEKEQGIQKRRKISGVGMLSEMIGNLLACAVLSMIPASVFAVCVGAGSGEWRKIFPVFWTSVLFSVMIALVCYGFAKGVRGLLAYQLTCTILLVGFGICGFCSMVEGILFPAFPEWFQWIPNCVYLRVFTGIMA